MLQQDLAPKTIAYNAIDRRKPNYNTRSTNNYTCGNFTSKNFLKQIPSMVETTVKKLVIILSVKVPRKVIN